ncbi:MarR family winged helix-turn-helix transcriptional regulator [Agrilactobacillus yilanensis]|uniref:MarR family winged helix-turn-helix transcriptional regulator n=1 Tax=Agrilactobacillus yilanensis TaxID=2485997 RepID=A0ABW4J789_9LACO|nr:helix-turn-helix domain-containing protein [Agrilactobacillus yilanensis]
MVHHFDETCAYFTAARYLRSVEQLANKTFAPTGLNPAYAYIMMALEDEHPATIRQISERLGYERSTVSRMLKTLVAKKLIILNHDQRATKIDLTEQSADFLKIANRCLKDFATLTDTILTTTKKPMTALLTENNQKIKKVL